MTHIRWLSSVNHISFLSNQFSVKWRFPFRVLRLNYLALLKDRFLKKNVIKRAKTHRLFSQNCRLKLFFYSNWKQFQVFKITKFEFKVTVHYGLWANCTQLWPLKDVNKDGIYFRSFKEIGTNSITATGDGTNSITCGGASFHFFTSLSTSSEVLDILKDLSGEMNSWDRVEEFYQQEKTQCSWKNH